MGYWEHFDHGADIGICGYGRSMAEAFAECGLALTAIVTPPEQVELRRRISVSCVGNDPELLLYDWINLVIREMSTRHMVFGRYEVTFLSGHLKADLYGEPVDIARHTPCVEPKGATFTGLSVRKSNGLWTARSVIDV